VPNALKGYAIALRPVCDEDGFYHAYFCHQRFMKIDLREKIDAECVTYVLVHVSPMSPVHTLRQKEGNQEKGDREAAALRIPKSRSQSGGVPQTRFAQTCVTLIP
ncbi:MAG: hypothetical protein ACI9ZF_000344, partial [Bradyrhizobium sp.]